MQVIKDYPLKLKGLGKSKKKHQIVLTHTSREISDYITSIKTRNNGNYNKIPNYVISKKGEVFRCIDDYEYTNYMNQEMIDKNSIIICLENLGWLEKTPLSPTYNNWIRSIYKGEIYERKWRDYFFWEPYEKEQLKVTSDLCKYLLKKFSIEKNCIGTNTKIDGIENYEGITTRSNYNSKFTDVSPAFDFEEFKKMLQNE